MTTTCATCMNHTCGHTEGQPGCAHYHCPGYIDAATANSCPGVPAAKAAVNAQAAAIKNMIMANVSPETRRAIHRLQRDGIAGESLRDDLHTALSGIADSFPARDQS